MIDLPSIFNDHSIGPKGQWWPWWYTMNLCVCYLFSGKLISNPHFSEQDWNRSRNLAKNASRLTGSIPILGGSKHHFCWQHLSIYWLESELCW
jgi:hypothetical protein